MSPLSSHIYTLSLWEILISRNGSHIEKMCSTFQMFIAIRLIDRKSSVDHVSSQLIDAQTAYESRAVELFYDRLAEIPSRLHTVAIICLTDFILHLLSYFNGCLLVIFID